MLHYNPRHVSSITMPVFRRTNCAITATGIVTLCKRLYSMPVESRLQSKAILVFYWILVITQMIPLVFTLILTLLPPHLFLLF